MNRREVLASLYRAALSGVDPEEAVSRARLPRPPDGIFAVGKAAAGMFRGARRIARDVPTLLILPKGYPAPDSPARGRVLFASHPEPDSSSVRAAKEAVEFFSGFVPKETILCLVSGGASSLLCFPRRGTTLSEKRAAVRRLAASGAGISELNRLRTSLSAVKGGRLGRKTAARLVTLVLSDVPGDRPSLVGSGPTIRGRKGDTVRVVGSNAMGLAAAARESAREGWNAVPRKRRLSGEAREEGVRFARAARGLAARGVLLAGGETTVRLSSRCDRGRGGRNLELALGAALELDGRVGIAVLAAGSDGVDGSSRAAGAFADGTTIARARGLGLDPEECLARHDSEAFFDRLGDLFTTGPTGTNVGDWAFALRLEG